MSKNLKSNNLHHFSLTALTLVATVVILGVGVSSMAQEYSNGDRSPGYWKNHPEAWECYSPDDLVSEVFGVQITIFTGGNPNKEESYIADPTLLEALGANGGGINELARNAVATLLNLCQSG